MKGRIYIIIIAILLTTGAVAAQKKPRTIEPCKLFTKDDAEKLLGGEAQLAESGAAGIETNCKYALTGERSGDVEFLTQVYKTPKDAIEADREARRVIVQSGTPTTISKAGDSAWFWKTSPTRAVIFVTKKNLAFEIFLFTNDPSEANLKRIARRIAARI